MAIIRRREDRADKGEQTNSKKRLFLGSFVSEDLQTICGSRIVVPKLRWTDINKLHLTWQFLGDQDESKERQLKNFLQEVRSTYLPITIEFQEIRIWPNTKNPKVLAWVGEIVSLAGDHKDIERKRKFFLKDFKARLKSICDFDDSRELTPHITIGRFSRGASFKDMKLLQQYNLPKTRWKIETMDLIESKLDTDGPSYRVM